MTRIKQLFLSITLILTIIISCTNAPVVHTVSYDTGGLNTISSIIIADGKALGEDELPRLADKGMKMFQGWFYDGNRVYPGYRVKKDITLKASWAKTASKGDKVMLAYASSIGVVPERIIVDKGAAVTAEMLDKPSGSDLLFEGWYADGSDHVFSPGRVLTQDTTLVARWEGGAGEHRLTFHDSDQDQIGQSHMIGHGGDADGLFVMLPPCARSWRTGDGTIWDLSWPIYSDLDLYAVFEMVGIGFYGADKNLIAEISICKDSLIPPMKMDGSFVWYTKDGVEWDFSKPVSESVDLYAEPVQFYKVEYDNNGHGEPIPSITVSAGHVLGQDELPGLESGSVFFYGWFDQHGTKVEPGVYEVSGDVKLTAKWLSTAVDEMKISNLGLIAHEKSVTLSWVNPSISDFERIKVEIRKESSSIGMYTVYIEGGPAQCIEHEFSNLASGYEYDFRLYPVFKNGIEGQREKIKGVPSRYAGRTAWVYGIEPPEDGRWQPETERLRERVYWEDGDMWFDVNKTHWSDKDKYPYKSSKWASDSNLCWAAGASNTIHWWMQNNKQYIERYGGYDGPSMYMRSNITDRYPTASEFQTSEIFQYFINNTWDDAGFDEHGINWFISGVDGYIDSPIVNPNRTGGFFRDVFENRPLSEMSKALGQGSMAQAFIKAFDNNMAINYTSMRPTIVLGHVMTIWGAEFDEHGYVSYVYSVDNNPGSVRGQIPGQMVRCAIDYQITPEGATHAMIEDYIKDVYYVIRDFRFTSLGTDRWEEYFRKNP